MAHRSTHSGYILALDVGQRRIGAAVASVIARLPRPLDVILADDQAIPKIKELIKTEGIELIVVGLPRNLQGEETAQSQSIREFTSTLMDLVQTPIVFADESLSSVRAESLADHPTFKNASSDSLAACFILEEYFVTHTETKQTEETN